MPDEFSTHSSTLNAPAFRAVVVSPSDSVDLALDARALWVGGAGNVRVTTSGGDDVVFQGVPAGSVLPVRCQRVWATNTTATLIVAMR